MVDSGAKTDFLLPFSHSGSTKTNFNAYFWLLLLDQKSSFFQYVLVYTQPTQIWREKGIKQIKILVWCFRNWGVDASGKLKNIFKKIGNCRGS